MRNYFFSSISWFDSGSKTSSIIGVAFVVNDDDEEDSGGERGSTIFKKGIEDWDGADELKSLSGEADWIREE